MQYTTDQKKEYFKTLRDHWQACKLASEQDHDAKAKWQAVNDQAGGKLSYTGFYFTLQSMKRQGLDGLPYVDAKTFQSWISSGFQVRKGEKSTISGITWINTGEEKEEDGFLFPKEYHLFHRSQVDPIIN